MINTDYMDPVAALRRGVYFVTSTDRNPERVKTQARRVDVADAAFNGIDPNLYARSIERLMFNIGVSVDFIAGAHGYRLPSLENKLDRLV